MERDDDIRFAGGGFLRFERTIEVRAQKRQDFRTRSYRRDMW